MSSIGETVVGNIESGKYDNYKWFGRLPKYIEEQMERMRNDPALMYGRSEIRVVVAGEPGTGKSTLIHNACCFKYREDGEDDYYAKYRGDGKDDGYAKYRWDGEEDGYAADVDHFVVLEPKRLPLYFHPKAVRLPVIALDTSSRGLDDEENVEKLKQADIILLTFGCDDLKTLAKLSDIWIPGLDRLQVKAPIMLVGCKADLKEKGLDLNNKCYYLGKKKNVVNLMMMRGNCELFRNSIECSAYQLRKVHEVFYHAQRSILEPTLILHMSAAGYLHPKLEAALKRIFYLHDFDKDGFIKVEDFNDFLEKYFGSEFFVEDLKRVYVRCNGRFDEKGIPFEGFLSFIYYSSEYDVMWFLLRQFGYNSDLELSDVLISSAMCQILDEAVELSNEAIEFLCWIFRRFGFDDVDLITQSDFFTLFSTAPESPFGVPPYKDAAEVNGQSLNGFLSLWALMTLLDPTCSMKNLIYIGYAGEPASAFSITRKRSTECKMGVDCRLQQQRRNVFQCFVFGPKKSGKSALLDSFIKRSHRDAYTPTSDCRYAANVVDQSWGTKKILVLREFPEDTVDTFLLNRGALAACDVAVFVYDSSDVLSRNGAINLLKKVAQHCKDTNSEVPMRYVAASNCSLSFVIQQAGQDTLLPITTEVGDSNDIFPEIAKAGGCPARKSELGSHAVMKSVSALKLVSSSLKVESSEWSEVGLQAVMKWKACSLKVESNVGSKVGLQVAM